MNDASHVHPLPPEAERRVRGLLDGSLSGGERHTGMEHVRICGACRELYDGIAVAERALSGTRDVLGVSALERVGARIQSDLPAAPRPRVWLRWAAAVATAASVAILGVRLLPSPVDDGFTPRGGPMEDGIGIRVFRIGAEGATEMTEGGVARPGDELGVSVSTGPYAGVRIAVRAAGRDASLAEATETVARGVIDEPLSWTVRIDPAYVDAGAVTVEARFSDPSSGDSPAIAQRVMRVRVEKAAP